MNTFFILNNIYYKANKYFKVKYKKYLFTTREKRGYIYRTLKKEKGNNINDNNNNLLILLI